MPYDDTSVNSSAAVAAARSSLQTDGTVPDRHQQRPISQRSSKNGSGIGINPLHRTADVQHKAYDIHNVELQHKVQATEPFENVTYLNSGEIKRCTSSHRQVFRASSSQQHSVTPFPVSAAFPDLTSNHKQQEFPSMPKPHDATLQHLQHDSPRSFAESGCERDEVAHKSFRQVVNLLVC